MNAIMLVIILALVEGITEFLPVSSTGHMILVNQIIGGEYLSPTFINSFLIIIQLGAILSVVVYFWKDISPFVGTKKEFGLRLQLWMKIIVGVLPAMVIGLLLDDIIDKYFMNNTLIIAITLIVYGVIFIGIEVVYKLKNIKPKVKKFSDLKYGTAFLIGFFQCLAMIPGTSRSGATIIGALLLGLSRPLAAEFSFYLAIPTMFGATALKLLKNGLAFTQMEWSYLALGSAIAFVVAYMVIKWFMDFIKKRSFASFGLYRIILGIIVIVLLY
ncbi:undecaprenyl-diphosphate phosphatase [Fusobacterium polymorphum]|jgi:undecaprenyl-diphosphatase uppP|uniref:undecaprenyl-diphosphate phosphatase n=1 Tax=Fusobacterium TaxID=848 RepID=UPI0028E22241|nr:undecaprenyl-diphosphate phosphatase [Fusobacterium hwasookii]